MDMHRLLDCTLLIVGTKTDEIKIGKGRRTTEARFLNFILFIYIFLG